ncbi:MAG: hypothetical protein HZA53_01390 [Planctomycetes bacterium]|nr:hypothetical protein [Planctomycetota bacterium]
MSPHDHDHDDHDHAPRAQGARRDLLGLAALLGPDSGLVPISDLDAGAEWPSACGVAHADHAPANEHAHGNEHAPASAPHALPTLCGSCTTRCATVELALGHSPGTERTA